MSVDESILNESQERANNDVNNGSFNVTQIVNLSAKFLSIFMWFPNSLQLLNVVRSDQRNTPDCLQFFFFTIFVYIFI